MTPHPQRPGPLPPIVRNLLNRLKATETERVALLGADYVRRYRRRAGDVVMVDGLPSPLFDPALYDDHVLYARAEGGAELFGWALRPRPALWAVKERRARRGYGRELLAEADRVWDSAVSRDY